MARERLALLCGEGRVAECLGAKLQARGVQVVAPTGSMPRGQLEVALVSHGAGKRAMQRALVVAEACVPVTTPILVSCLGQSLAEAATWARHPERLVGFAALPPMEGAVVEVTKGLLTNEGAWRRACDFLRETGLEPETVGDGVGLVLGRTLAMLINEAVTAWSEGIASREDIERAMVLGVNYPRGLLEWAERIGLDQVLAILDGLWEEWREERYRPAPILRRLVWAGKGFAECDLP